MCNLVAFDLGKSPAEYCASAYQHELGDIVIVFTFWGIRMGRVVKQVPQLPVGEIIPNGNRIIATLDVEAIHKLGRVDYNTLVYRDVKKAESMSYVAEIMEENLNKLDQVIQKIDAED